MKRILLPLLICIVAIAIVAGISYQAIVGQQPAGTGESSSSGSDVSASSDESEQLATSNVSYRGTVEEVAAPSTTGEASSFKLTMTDGTYVFLESTDLNLSIRSYLGKHVEVRGSAQPSSIPGILLLRAEEVTLLDAATSSSESESGASSSSVSATFSSSVSALIASSASQTLASSRSSAASMSTKSSVSSSLQSSSASSTSSETTQPDTSAAMNEQVLTMMKQKYDEALWTQQYCTSHIAFCIPVHKNWYFKSFGATTSNFWHVEFGVNAIDQLNQGAIVLNLVSGTSASMDAVSGQVKTQGADVIGFFDWNDNQHFELIADARLKDVVSYMLSKITSYTPPTQ